ncbi:MAG: hypothetical protein ACRDRN_20650 [Sciscionella sp.]
MAASKGTKSGKSGIVIKKSHAGRLHRALGVPEGQPIPTAKLAAAKNSSDPAIRKEATFAINAKGFHHTAAAKKTTTKKTAGGKTAAKKRSS